MRVILSIICVVIGFGTALADTNSPPPLVYPKNILDKKQQQQLTATRHHEHGDQHPVSYRNDTIARNLDWKLTNDPTNLCGGFFYQPNWLANAPLPSNKPEPVHVTSKGPVTYLKSGDTKLQDNVVIKQPSRIAYADVAYIHRSIKTHKIERIELIGHVRIRENGRIITGTHGYLWPQTNRWTMFNPLYHVSSTGKDSSTEVVNNWGKSTHAHESNKVMYLHDASYTNSSPLHPSWMLHASRLRLDNNQGFGVAHNVWFGFYGVPIFWAPYWKFPITNKRQSGFLEPLFGYGNQDGMSISVPYYLNLAPNYDLTITPNWIQHRGVLTGLDFRYMSEHTHGDIQLSGIYNDQLFNQFRKDTPALYPNPSPAQQVMLDQLSHTSDMRGYISAQNQTNITKYLTSSYDINYVTDAYYFTDYQTGSMEGAGLTQPNQLLNDWNINYERGHWTGKVLLQAYQTLHQINQPAASDQYQRLPEADVNGNYNNILHAFNASISMQAVNFGYNSDFNSQPIGQRYHVQPTISAPINFAAGYITPSVSFDGLYDHTMNIPNTTNQPLRATAERQLPIYDVQSGIYFERQFHLFGYSYNQTLEPRIGYLYVPYSNQDQLPVYDTILLPFDYNTVFATNRFAGVDRLQNANQLQLGIQTSIAAADTGTQQLMLGIGMIDYFSPRKVCLSTNCETQSNHYSPIASTLTFNPFTNWSSTTDAAWSTQYHDVANVTTQIEYSTDQYHKLIFGYTYLNGQRQTPPSRLLTFGVSFPVANVFDIFGYTAYDVTNGYGNQYTAGLQYNNCGWALRTVFSRDYRSINPITSTSSITRYSYENKYYVQFILTGLAAFGHSPLQDIQPLGFTKQNIAD